MTKHFLKITDFTRDEIMQLLKLSAQLKQEKQHYQNHQTTKKIGNKYFSIEWSWDSSEPIGQRLAGKNIALIFEKTSTRTRCAFEVACHDQGAYTTYLTSHDSQMGHKESIKDTARVLGRMYDGIVYRGFDQSIVDTLAQYSGVPVFNALTDQQHPTQVLADVLTMCEVSGKAPHEITFSYVGDARNNIARSQLAIASTLGMKFRIGAPKALQPSEEWLTLCQQIAKENGAEIIITEDPLKAVDGVDFIHTDVWVSMGEPESVWAERIALLKPYRVDSQLMDATHNPNCHLMHCLPAYHNRETTIGQKVFEQFGLDGVEVSEEVFEASAPIIFTQAENRMHTIKAILVSLLEAR